MSLLTVICNRSAQPRSLQNRVNNFHLVRIRDDVCTAHRASGKWKLLPFLLGLTAQVQDWRDGGRAHLG